MKKSWQFSKIIFICEFRFAVFETFKGEPGLVWPIVVFNVIRQFKTNLR
jgi:hypothetical protein